MFWCNAAYTFFEVAERVVVSCWTIQGILCEQIKIYLYLIMEWKSLKAEVDAVKDVEC